MIVNKMDNINDLFLRIALKDDKIAFHELYVQFFTPLVVYAQRYIASLETCEDIVQNTFLKIWENRQSYEIHVSGKNLLVTFVKNACIDYLRKRKYEQEYISKIDRTLISDDDIYSIRELEQMLSAALARLPEKLRRVFEMNRFERKTYAEIAEHEKLSVKSIEKYMSNALKILYTELKDYLTLFL